MSTKSTTATKKAPAKKKAAAKKAAPRSSSSKRPSSPSRKRDTSPATVPDELAPELELGFPHTLDHPRTPWTW